MNMVWSEGVGATTTVTRAIAWFASIPTRRRLSLALAAAVTVTSFSSIPARQSVTTGATPVTHHHEPTRHAAQTNTADIGGAQAQRPATIVRPLSCERLPHVSGKSITTAVVEFPPGAFSPRHRHPGSVTAFVLRGAIRSQLAGGPAGTFASGETWFEPPGAIHLFAENASQTEPAELLAIFVADDDCGPLTIPED